VIKKYCREVWGKIKVKVHGLMHFLLSIRILLKTRKVTIGSDSWRNSSEKAMKTF
jgi:hypothetical protein